MTDQRLSLGESLCSTLDCADCVLGNTENEFPNVACAVKVVADARDVRQNGRPFFCSAFVPRRCDCGMRGDGE